MIVYYLFLLRRKKSLILQRVNTSEIADEKAVCLYGLFSRELRQMPQSSKYQEWNRKIKNPQHNITPLANVTQIYEYILLPVALTLSIRYLRADVCYERNKTWTMLSTQNQTWSFCCFSPNINILISVEGSDNQNYIFVKRVNTGIPTWCLHESARYWLENVNVIINIWPKVCGDIYIYNHS